MGNRLTKIYTRTGDSGTTGMAGGARVKKDDVLLHAIGDIDELNSQLAVLACHVPDVFVDEIKSIQNDLFDVGAELFMGQTDNKQAGKNQTSNNQTSNNQTSNSQTLITAGNIDQLEKALDTMNLSLTPLKEFILPGGGLAASHCHVARAICRRAERSLVSANKVSPVSAELLAYVNRLSDYLFVLARSISQQAGEDEVYWHSNRLNAMNKNND